MAEKNYTVDQKLRQYLLDRTPEVYREILTSPRDDPKRGALLHAGSRGLDDDPGAAKVRQMLSRLIESGAVLSPENLRDSEFLISRLSEQFEDSYKHTRNSMIEQIFDWEIDRLLSEGTIIRTINEDGLAHYVFA